MKIDRLSIPHGEAGTDATVRIMRAMIEDGKRDQVLRQLAEHILRTYKVPRYQYVAELAALHDWVRRHVRYTKDPHEVEYIQTPNRLLETRMGDCDDMSVLLGSLAEVIGHPVGIKVVSRDAGQNYHHVYPVAEVNGREYGLDASVPFPFGFQSPEIKKEKVYPSHGVGDMKDVFNNLGKAPISIRRPAGGDGAVTGTVVTAGTAQRIQVVGVGQRICGPDVAERVKAGFIKPALGTKLRILSAAESNAGSQCVTAERVDVVVSIKPPSVDENVYEKPIEPPVIQLRPFDIVPDKPVIAQPPPILTPVTLQAGQQICRPNVVTLLDQGLIKAAPGTVLKVTQGKLGLFCVSANFPTDVVPERPVIGLRPPVNGKLLPEPGEPVIHPVVDDVFKPITDAAGTVIEKVQEEGPLGIPWFVWLGATGLLLTLLRKK